MKERILEYHISQIHGNTGKLEIISGEVIGENYGIASWGNSPDIIGSKGNPVSISNPIIESGFVGLNVTDSQYVEFYDGIIKGKRGGIFLEKGEISKVESDYAIYTTKNGEYEESYLKKLIVAELLEDNLTYNGTQQEAKVKVTWRGTELEKDKDYTVVYTNNLNVGPATVTITGINDYTGTVILQFNIINADFTGELKIDGKNEYGRILEANISGITPKDFTGIYQWWYSEDANAVNPENAGSRINITPATQKTYKIGDHITDDILIGKYIGVTLTASKANYNEKIFVAITTVNNGTDRVQAKDINGSDVNASLTLNPNEFTYDGNPKTPDTIVVVDGVTLEKGKDYDVTYKNNVEIGTATASITGKGNYKGTLSEDFEIRAISLKDAKLRLDPNTFVYDGFEKMPNTILTIGDIELKRNVDYEVEYFNNVNVGNNTASAVCTGLGNYRDQITGYFSITGISLSSATAELTETVFEYDGKEKTPSAIVVLEDGTALQQDVDFEIKYENNIEVGTAKATIVGKGNYSGEINLTFEITKATVALKLKDKIVAYTGNAVSIDAVEIESALESEIENIREHIEYKYYPSYQSEEAMTSLPVDDGVYYVQAELIGLRNYNDEVSNKVTLVIYGRPTASYIRGQQDGYKITPSGSVINSSIDIYVYGSIVPNVNLIEHSETINVGYKYSYDKTKWDIYTDKINISEGKVTVYAKAYIVGHEELESDIVSYEITIDRTPPTLGEGDVKVPEIVDSVVIEPEVVNDDVSEVYVTSDPSDDPTKGNPKGEWKKLDDENKTVFELEQGDGEKDIYVWGRDDVGNIDGPVHKKVTLSALKIGNQNNNKTTIKFKITDDYLHIADLDKKDIRLYVNQILSSGSVTELTKTETEKGYIFTATIENVTGDGNLSIEVNSTNAYDKAGNKITEIRVPTNEITVDNTLPNVSTSLNDRYLLITAYDEHMKAITVNGETISKKSGEYAYELKNGTNILHVIDEYGNEVIQEIEYNVE